MLMLKRHTRTDRQTPVESPCRNCRDLAPEYFGRDLWRKSSGEEKYIIVQYDSTQNGGEGGIRTDGTVTRTTVFEFYDSRAGVCRTVPKRVIWFANFGMAMSPCNP